MNRTRIEWVVNPDGMQGFTWNPIVGCTRECSYCYARRQAKRFKQLCQQCYDFMPHLHRERLDEPLCRKKPATIFLGSMAEMWGPGVLSGWLAEVASIVRDCPQHTFLSLTKEPLHMVSWLGDDYFENWWLGTTVESAQLQQRVLWLSGRGARFVSFEPLLGPTDRLDSMSARSFDWAIIGGQSGRGARPPELAWVKDLLDDLQSWGIPVFVKDNCPWEDAWGPKPRALPYPQERTE